MRRPSGVKYWGMICPRKLRRRSIRALKTRTPSRRSSDRWFLVHPNFKGGNRIMVTRRVFLRGSAIVMAGMGVAPEWLARAAASLEASPYQAGAPRGSKKRKTLVAIFMRGAADGLNIVVPFGDKQYKELRPTIAIAPPSTQTNGNAVNGGTIDLDGTFALNGAMQPLRALWDKKQLAIVEATGSPDPSRSHFEAQDSMECGT